MNGEQCLIFPHLLSEQRLLCTIGWVTQDENERGFKRCAEMFPICHRSCQAPPIFSLGALTIRASPGHPIRPWKPGFIPPTSQEQPGPPEQPQSWASDTSLLGWAEVGSWEGVQAGHGGGCQGTPLLPSGP